MGLRETDDSELSSGRTVLYWGPLAPVRKDCRVLGGPLSLKQPQVSLLGASSPLGASFGVKCLVKNKSSWDSVQMRLLVLSGSGTMVHLC